MTEGLDYYASSVTPPDPARAGRRMRYRLRSVAGRIMPKERVLRCGVAPHLGHVDLVVKNGSAFYGGVETCGSVWHCPVCAAKIAEGRRAEVEATCEAHSAVGGSVYMAAFTIPHDRFQTCRELRAGVALAWRKFQQGEPFKRAKAKASFVGSIRALEITHGEHGWHPHLHVLFFLGKDATEKAADTFGRWAFERWARIVADLGFGSCSPGAYRFERARSVAASGDYIAKWGCDSEIAKGHLKKSKGGSSPWQLLERAERGDKRAVALFKEYAEAFKGARHLTWSRGLKKLYGIEDREDEEIAADVGAADIVGQISRPVFWKIRKRGLLCAVLEVAEVGGWGAVLKFLQAKGVLNGDRTRNLIPPRGGGRTVAPRLDDRTGAYRWGNFFSGDQIGAVEFAAP